MYRQNKIVAAVTFAFFAWLMYSGLQFPGVASYMPVFVSCMGMLCSVVLFATVCLKEKKGQKIDFAVFFPKKETIQILEAFALIVLYCLLMKPVGFVITSFVFFFLFSLCFGEKKKIVQYLILSAVVVAVIYIGFGVTLHTSFPEGILI